MRKVTFLLTVMFGLFLYLSIAGWAQKPVMKEQLVYKQRYFNGKGYGGKGYPDAFTPPSEDTIYLIADHDNAVSAWMSLVYFWPVTGKYRINWEGLNQPAEGTLEILKEGKVIDSLEKTDNCIFYLEGYTGGVSRLYSGEKAKLMREEFEKAVDYFYYRVDKWKEQMQEYTRQQAELQQEMERLGQKWRETGEEPTGAEIEELVKKRTDKPELPQAPEAYVTELWKDYIINLPAGTYNIRIRTKEGSIVQDSEKRLVLFSPRKTEMVGYEIVLDTRWAQPELCQDPASIIYVDLEYVKKNHSLYFKPFYQNEYNEFYYNKLADPQNFGRKKRWKWIQSGNIKDGVLVFLNGKKVVKESQNVAYYVREVEGEKYTFEIIEHSKDNVPSGAGPTFGGHKLEFTPDVMGRNRQINLNKENTYDFFKQAKREIRVVSKETSRYLYPFALFPLVIGLVSFVQRRRKLK
ncbi:hypothetical protein IBX65_01055 [Candidatus Aerophobetes bacterium]|nr:hypothetical protein [Candidatus Aerophobetes bacterium]